jgi:hypothetical protein
VVPPRVMILFYDSGSFRSVAVFEDKLMIEEFIQAIPVCRK